MNTKMTKAVLRSSRISAIKILYHYDLTQSKIIDLESLESDAPTDFTNTLVEGVLNRLEEIDQIIKDNLVKYTIDRLSFVDRAVVRLATFELLSKTPVNIVVNEALEIVGEYSDLGDGKNKKFIHRLLDTIYKSLCKTI